ncbi:hypothetical protein BJP05_04320 [Corynebacterium sp. NML98-0116]|nr:hypothetical protein BJP05_04320 [Corynebacterium sp. NML98-0116]
MLIWRELHLHHGLQCQLKCGILYPCGVIEGVSRHATSRLSTRTFVAAGRLQMLPSQPFILPPSLKSSEQTF